jgi:DNA modification methylase
VWEINTQNVGVKHFATFPPALVRRCLATTSTRNGLVLDPFLGSGTTGAVALEMERRFIGVELHAEYVAGATKRVSAVLADA